METAAGIAGRPPISTEAAGPLWWAALQETSMNGKSLQKWMSIGLLALAPLAHAQGTQAMDEGMRTSADVALTAVTPTVTKGVDPQQQIAQLLTELEAIRSDLDAQRAREDRREMAIGDPDSHPLWP